MIICRNSISTMRNALFLPYLQALFPSIFKMMMSIFTNSLPCCSFLTNTAVRVHYFTQRYFRVPIAHAAFFAVE